MTETNQSSPPISESDRPLDDPALDLFDRQHFARNIYETLVSQPEGWAVRVGVFSRPLKKSLAPGLGT